jgi:hypothetical protein
MQNVIDILCRNRCVKERLRNDLQEGPKPSMCVAKTYCNDKVIGDLIGDTFPQPCSSATGTHQPDRRLYLAGRRTPPQRLLQASATLLSLERDDPNSLAYDF